MLTRWHAWPRGVRWLAGGIAALVLALAIAWVLFVPAADWLAHHDVGSAKGPLIQTARDAARGRLLTLGAGLFAAGALLYTARNFTLSREGQVTDRYTKAIEQLGSDKLDVRIGGIYALERIARDSARDHPTVMEVLSAFVREHSREDWPPPDPNRRKQERSTRPDVQAALAVVGHRDPATGIRPIDLTGANLTGANLTDADFSGASLVRANLVGAYLVHANLTGTHFTGANLAGANLSHTNLVGAYLLHANLTDRADLTDANLTDADLTGADLTGAGLIRAKLTHACLIKANLTGANLTSANLTSANLTDARLNRARWPRKAAVPKGWVLDTDSGLLAAAGTGSGPASPHG